MEQEMNKLSEEKRDDLKALLEDHQKVTDALFNIEKSSFVPLLTVIDEKANDSTEVILTVAGAKIALRAHQEWVEMKLKKFGIEISK